MTVSNRHIFLVLLFVFVSSCLLTCSPKQTMDIKETGTEIWELQLTGEVVGKLKMVLTRIKIEGEIYAVTGRFSGRLRDYRAGTGTGVYEFEGKIEKELFKVNFSGNSNMEAGPSPTSGRLSGTVYKSKGSGKYSVLHAFGSSHGDYIMRKTHSN